MAHLFPPRCWVTLARADRLGTDLERGVVLVAAAPVLRRLPRQELGIAAWFPGKPDGGHGDGGGEPDDPSSESSSDNSRSSKVSSVLRMYLAKSKIKEADDIEIPKSHSIPAYRARKNLAYKSINTASSRPDDKAMRWAM